MSGGGENEDRVQKGKALRFTHPSSKNEDYVATHISKMFFSNKHAKATHRTRGNKSTVLMRNYDM